MQANWSLILNVILLIGVVVAIGRLMKARRQSLNHVQYQPSLGPVQPPIAEPNDIIAVRRVNYNTAVDEQNGEEKMPVEITTKVQSKITTPTPPSIRVELNEEKTQPTGKIVKNEAGKSLMMFLLAKENRQLVGYELLQTVLASGLRFGEGHLFHRHQQANGQGSIICSLAAATTSGIFDLQNIGAFSVRGLCLFMKTSGNSNIDSLNFSIMHETAIQLSEGLDAHLLDDQRDPLTTESLARYHNLIESCA